MHIDIKILFSALLDLSLYPLMSKNHTKLSSLCSHSLSWYDMFTDTLGLKTITSFRPPIHVCLESPQFLNFCSLYIMAYIHHQYFTTGLVTDLYNFKCVLLNIIISVSVQVKHMPHIIHLWSSGIITPPKCFKINACCWFTVRQSYTLLVIL